MSPERSTHIDALFHRARSLPAAERESFVRRESRGDPELADEVLSLLRYDDIPGVESFGTAIGARVKEQIEELAAPEPLIGTDVGPYRIVALLARGGMGAVYRASRQDGLVSRDVAVKVVHGWGTSLALRRRFKREWQALAHLRHPNICPIVDVGLTTDGMPYLVMELIEGEPIDAYCDRHRLPVADRIRLFDRVVRAVHFAHQNLVVHRDLKPANVLVTGEGTPVLLDFGIAKLLDAGDDPAETSHATMILTPDYASPEQLRGDRVTIGMDVYALGVMLHELLCGARPPRATSSTASTQGASLPRPSTVISHLPRALAGPLASHRSTTPARLRRALRGDLDNVLRTAMHDDPDRRYGSALMLADDLQRHLRGDPVAARPDSVAYRLTAFARRNKAAVAIGAIALGALAAGTVATAWQARIAERERDLANTSQERAERAAQQAAQQAARARIEADSARQFSEFLVDGFVLSADERQPAQLERYRTLLDRRAVSVRLRFGEQPSLCANLLDALGRVCMHLHFDKRAATLLGEAAAMREQEFGPESIEYALSLESRGELAFRRGDYESAQQAFSRALALHRELPESVHTDVARLANDLAVVRRRLGDARGSEALHREALARRREAHGDRHPKVAESLNNLAALSLRRGAFDEARARLEEALSIREATLGAEHPLVAQTLNNLAAVAKSAGDEKEARARLEEAVRRYRALGTEAEPLAQTLVNLAETLRDAGEVRAARATIEEALEIHRARLRPDHPHLATALIALGNIDYALGKPERACEVLSEGVEIRRAAYGDDHPRVALARSDHGRALLANGRLEEAEKELSAAASALRELPRDHRYVGTVDLNLAACLVRLGRAREAEDLLVSILRRFDDDHPIARTAATHLEALDRTHDGSR